MMHTHLDMFGSKRPAPLPKATMQQELLRDAVRPMTPMKGTDASAAGMRSQTHVPKSFPGATAWNSLAATSVLIAAVS